MKPLLVIPPAPNRWPALLPLLETAPDALRADLEARLTRGIPEARDAFALIVDGGQCLGLAGLAGHGGIGVISILLVRGTHRRRGLGRRLLDALVSWFDMVGGASLYARSVDAASHALISAAGFRELHRATSTDDSAATFVRDGAVRTEAGPAAACAALVRPLTRADWPAMVALLQSRPGADPRVPLAESAFAAEQVTLTLLQQTERGTCHLLGTFAATGLDAFASVATDVLGERTYAAITPFGARAADLRAALDTFARGRGYNQITFPMDLLA